MPVPAVQGRAGRGDGESGQAFVLAALLMLFVSVVIFVTFGIGHRVREKIKLQALADSTAYSMAVAEARAFNFFAYSNRAVAGQYVSILSLQSHESFLNFYMGVLKKTAQAYNDVSSQLDGADCACDGPASRAHSIANLFSNASQQLENQYQDGKPIHDAVGEAARAHWGIAHDLRKVQQPEMYEALKQLLNGGMEPLARAVDDDIRLVSTGTSRDQFEQACAQTKEGHEVIYATRYPAWLHNRTWTVPPRWSNLMSQAQQIASPDSTSVVVSSQGTSRLARREEFLKALHEQDIETGGAAGAEDHGAVVSSYNAASDLCLCSPASAHRGLGGGAEGFGVLSGPHELVEYHYHYTHMDPQVNTGSHRLGGCADENDPETCGVYGGSLGFVLGSAPLYNQPRTLAVLAKNPGAKRFAWDFDFRFHQPLDARFKTVDTRGDNQANGRMVAVAGGLTYYHRPSSWREPPSFWNPFWRAKLHPLRKAHAKDALEGVQPAASALMSAGNNRSILNY